MMDDQYHVHDLVAAYVLGAVTSDEAALVEDHLPTCAECRALADELREVEALLPNLAGELEPTPALKSRIMAAVAAEPRGAAPAGAQAAPDGAGPSVAPPTPLPLRPRQTQAARRLDPRIYAAIAAVVVVAIAAAVILRALTTSPGPTRVYAVGGTPAMRSITGTLSYYSGDNHATLDLSGLKKLPSNKVYELWLVHVNAGKVVSALGVVAFRPDAQGKAAVTVRGHKVPDYQLAGFTIERAPIARVPTFPMVAQALLPS